MSEQTEYTEQICLAESLRAARLQKINEEAALEEYTNSDDTFVCQADGELFVPDNKYGYVDYENRFAEETDIFMSKYNPSVRKDIFELALLPHQIALMEDTSSKILGLISGYGAGKTFIVARKAVQLASLNPGCDGIITEPNFPLLTQILVPEMHFALLESGLRYIFKTSENIFYVSINNITTRIICKSMERYDRLIGINAAWVISDEFDTTKASIAYQAFLKLLGRLRAGNVRQYIITTTPEGFGAAHRIFEEEKRGRLIRAKTTDNIFLPADYIKNLYEMYPPNLVKAYIEGAFVNLQGNTVYTSFDRALNHASIELEGGEDILVGIDFNIGGCAVKCAVAIKEELYGFKEYLGKDTHDVGSWIADTFKNHRVYIYPDASGNSKSTNASQSDIQILEDYGLVNMSDKKNPFIRDRVLSVDNGFRHKKTWIDTIAMPELTSSLERQVYDTKENPEKLPGAGTIDDHNDAWGYLVQKIMPVIQTDFYYRT